MNPNFQTAIIEFIANEFHLTPESLSEETNFKIDLNLTDEEVAELLQRLQDSLSFIIPDDKESNIESVGDLVAALSPDTHQPDTFI